MFSPFHNTHTLLLVYSDKVSTVAKTFTHHHLNTKNAVDNYNTLKSITYEIAKQ